MKDELLRLNDPTNYFEGVGKSRLPTPTNVLLFVRREKKMLQQEALQNRSHHRFVLVLNLETDGHVHVDNLALPIKPQQALLILPYQFHHFSQLASNRLKWLFCTFEMEPRTFLESLRNRIIDINEHTWRVYEDMIAAWHQPHSELQAELLQTIVLRLLLLLKQARAQTCGDLPAEPEDNLVRTVNRLMAEWRGRTVVVGDLAEETGYSESRLRVLFKEVAGIPLGSYIQNYRLNRAMALLRTSELSIAGVAEEAGFGSPQAFSRIFRKETGQTPRDYRQTTIF